MLPFRIPSAWFVVGLLVASVTPIAGPSASDAVPNPLAPCAFNVSQGNHDYPVDPVAAAQSVISYYDYWSVSAHTPYVEPYASVLFLYTDATTGALYLVIHFNVDAGGSPDAETNVEILGIPAGATAALSDDPGEFRLNRFPQGQFHYWDNTDGGVLGPLPTATSWAMKVDASHFGVDPMRSQKWVDGDGTRLPLDLAGQIVIASECNRAPTADAGGPYSGVEGTSITFNAGGSSDPDGDPLTYAWDFQNDGTTDVTTTNPSTSWTYPDDFDGKARLTVSDGQASASTTVDVTVANVAPTVVLDDIAPAAEGAGTVATLRVTDPGADLVVVEFDQGDLRGPVVVGQVFNPKEYLITKTVTWGDDGLFSVVVAATDDDGGVGTAGAIVQITNEIPGITAVSNPSATTYEEGDEAEVELRARDNGSDDLRIDVDFGNGDLQGLVSFNDGVGPDPDPSPLGTYPFEVSATFRTKYVDDGSFTIRITAEDDDGGIAVLEFPIVVLNVAPTIQPFRPASAVEGSPGSLAATATDPGNDALTFVWEFELGPTATESFPATGSPMTATSTASFLYGDDGSYVVRLIVTDDDGGVATYETTVEVANLPPTVQITQVQRPASLTLRVAGEKWHDVRAVFFEDGVEIGFLSVVRLPGSPDEQAASTGDLDLDPASRYTAKVLYTPEDDPVNGQPNGANPVWIIARTPDGQEVRIHHTFNVQHPGTYEWDVDLTPQLAGLAIRFEASATDPGSDDLTFTWDWGDGTTPTSATVYNQGASADPAKSPAGTFPFAATDARSHAFPGPGTYVLVLTVADDDGGFATTSLTITIAG